MDKNIYCISDLHIGNRTYRDNFSETDLVKPFLSFLSFIEQTQSKLIIVGDLFELWQNTVGDVLQANNDIIKILGRLDVCYIVGNHDADLLSLNDGGFLAGELGDMIICNRNKNGVLCSEYTKQVGDAKYVFKHGHDVDGANLGNIPGLGRLLTIFAGMVKDYIKCDAKLKTYEVENVLEVIPEYAAGALSKIKETYEEVISLGGLFGKSDDRVNKSMLEGSEARIDDFKRMHTFVKYFPLFYQMTVDLKKCNSIDSKANIEALKIKFIEEYNHENVLVTGHTHNPCYDGNWYWNTGRWDNKSLDVLEIKYNETPKLKVWDKQSEKLVQ